MDKTHSLSTISLVIGILCLLFVIIGIFTDNSVILSGSLIVMYWNTLLSGNYKLESRTKTGIIFTNIMEFVVLTYVFDYGYIFGILWIIPASFLFYDRTVYYYRHYYKNKE